MQEWLRANHRRLLAVADALVDHRDELLRTTASQRRTDLAAAIDRAGEEISSQPSRLLAAAVTYAMFLVRSGDPDRLSEDIREALAAHAHLHPEFNRLRDLEGPR